MTLQVGVKVILKNSEGRFLLLKRNPETYQGVTPWDIPGGRINIGSPLRENLEREVTEETGLTITSTPKLLTAQDILRTDKHVVRLTYSADCTGEPILDTTENTEFRWVLLEDLPFIEGLDEFAHEAFEAFIDDRFPKLVRDKQVEYFRKKFNIDITTFSTEPDDTKYLGLLYQKLIEESKEASHAQTDDTQKEELADTLEVLYAILKTKGWTMAEIQSILNQKREHKGGFDNRIIMLPPKI